MKTKSDLIVTMANAKLPSTQEKLSNQSGVYSYHYGKYCIYVGASWNLYSRALRGLGVKKINDRLTHVIEVLDKKRIKVKIIFSKEEEIAIYEKRLIGVLRPLLNDVADRSYQHNVKNIDAMAKRRNISREEMINLLVKSWD